MKRAVLFVLSLALAAGPAFAADAPKAETGNYCGVATEKGGVWKYVSDNASADPAPPAKK